MAPRTLAAGVLAALALCVACQPRGPITPVVIPVPPPPAAPQVAIVGDSTIWQYQLAGGEADWPDALWDTGPGMTADVCNVAGCVPPLPWLADHPVDIAVLFLGVNDSDTVWDGGWQPDDVAAWTPLLAAAPCVVVVLPWLADSATEAHRAAVHDARAWLVANHPNTVDWAGYANQPDVLDPDGIHLEYAGTTVAQAVESVGGDFAALGALRLPITPAAADARRAVITDAIERCQP